MQITKEILQRKLLILKIFVFILSIIIFLGGAALLLNISEKKHESENPFFKVVELTDEIDDPAIWGSNFPHQYADYLKTVDQTKTNHGGSEALPNIPTTKDPREYVSKSKLDEIPFLKQMWSGYAFSKDFREERGHAFMLTDQLYTERQNAVKQPGACINCHGSTVKAMKELGKGDIHKGFHELNKLPYFEAKKFVNHPVACIDCHDPKNMELRITRPAFINGIKASKLSMGIKDYDLNKASRQEMKTFVCAQCHVEYYFKGKDKTLTYPWNKGLKADEILSYYDDGVKPEERHKDWIHKETGAAALKAQHPEFELWSQGLHAKSGVSCVDCHMPYKRQGAMKITDHHVRSPVLNISKSCQTCHHFPEDELKERISTIQDRHIELRNVAMGALKDFLDELTKYKNSSNVDAKKLKLAQEFQRKSQFLFDFIEAENSAGFHAPQEAARILGLSIDYARKGQNSLK